MTTTPPTVEEQLASLVTSLGALTSTVNSILNVSTTASGNITNLAAAVAKIPTTQTPAGAQVSDVQAAVAPVLAALSAISPQVAEVIKDLET